MRLKSVLLFVVVSFMFACNTADTEVNSAAASLEDDMKVQFMVRNPGHFHAGLVFKDDYDDVSRDVAVYAPDGKELDAYMALVDQYNTRAKAPTAWQIEQYAEDAFAEVTASGSKDVLVLAGNNAKKIDYVKQAVDQGINVLADKPMVIDPDKFGLLEDVMQLAGEKGLVVNDIMTERHEITTIIQRLLAQDSDLFGELVPGSPEVPAISKESVHFFSKQVSGKPLIRPAWFFDDKQQGHAIVDVSTHLVDLILWQCFPDEFIDYKNPSDEVAVVAARTWDTPLTLTQFAKVTQETAFPDYLAPNLADNNTLNVAANGEFVFKARGVHGKVSVRWGFENPEGGDTHYSIMRGTKANLVIRQDKPQNYKATLYVEPLGDVSDQAFAAVLASALDRLPAAYDALTVQSSEFGWEIQIPDAYREGHEAHFARVTRLYLEYLEAGKIAHWERINLLTKYYITTQAYRMGAL